MKIAGLQKLTLLDFPDRVAAIVFLGGCNFRCPFCQNSSLVFPSSAQSELSLSELEQFLRKRSGILEGVCVTGGEPTLHADLPELFSMIRTLGYQTKLDTNGSNPQMLQMLLGQNLLDYVAMDIKAGRQNYSAVCGLSSSESERNALLARIDQSISLLKHSSISYEYRTTVVKGLHTDDDFLDIREWIADAPAYYLQSFRDCPEILTPNHSFDEFSAEKLQDFLKIVQKKIPTAKLRGLS